MCGELWFEECSVSSSKNAFTAKKSEDRLPIGGEAKYGGSWKEVRGRISVGNGALVEFSVNSLLVSILAPICWSLESTPGFGGLRTALSMNGLNGDETYENTQGACR